MNQPFQQHPGFPSSDELMEQQQLQHQLREGAAFNRTRATSLAGRAVEDSYDISPRIAEVRSAIELLPDSAEILDDMSDITRLRRSAVALKEGEMVA